MILQEFVRRIFRRCVNIAKQKNRPIGSKRKRDDENVPPPLASLSNMEEKGNKLTAHASSESNGEASTAPASLPATLQDKHQQQQQQQPQQPVKNHTTADAIDLKKNVPSSAAPSSSSSLGAARASVETNGSLAGHDENQASVHENENGVLATIAPPPTAVVLQEDKNTEDVEMIDKRLLFKALRFPDVDNHRDPIGRFFPSDETLEDLILSSI